MYVTRCSKIAVSANNSNTILSYHVEEIMISIKKKTYPFSFHQTYTLTCAVSIAVRGRERWGGPPQPLMMVHCRQCNLLVMVLNFRVPRFTNQADNCDSPSARHPTSSSLSLFVSKRNRCLYTCVIVDSPGFSLMEFQYCLPVKGEMGVITDNVCHVSCQLIRETFALLLLRIANSPHNIPQFLFHTKKKQHSSSGTCFLFRFFVTRIQ